MPSDTSIDASFAGDGPVLGRAVVRRAHSKETPPARRQREASSVSQPQIKTGDSIARVDRSHVAANEKAATKEPGNREAVNANDFAPTDPLAAAGATDSALPPETAALSSREAWLNYHASDLIIRLQEWATDLDAREASLNAAYARQDLRERQFRLCRQQVESQIADHLAAAEALRGEIHAHARRLAFELH